MFTKESVLPVLFCCNCICLYTSCTAIFDVRCYNNIQPTVCLPERNGGSHPAAQFCVHIICINTNNVVPIKYVNKIPNHIYNPPINVCLQNLFYPFSLLAAIHLFISSHNEIEDFCSMDKLMRRDVTTPLQILYTRT